MKFICGNCKELIREVISSRNTRSWQTHEKCGHETEFDNYVTGMTKGEPVALRSRKVEKKQAPGKSVDGKPSGADLDKDAKEKEVVAATSGQAKK